MKKYYKLEKMTFVAGAKNCEFRFTAIYFSHDVLSFTESRKLQLKNRMTQARRLDSVTGGKAEINFRGHEKFIYVNSRRAREHEKLIPVWIKRTR